MKNLLPLIQTKYAVIISVVLFASTLFIIRSRRKKYVRVGKVDRLFIYPIKGCKGIEVEQIQVTRYGLIYKNLKDRMFSFVDAKNQLVNMQTVAKVGLISLRLEDDHLLALCDDIQRSIEIPIKQFLVEGDKVLEAEFKKRKIKGVICDESINAFFADYLGIHVKLIQHLPELKYRSANTVKKCDAEFEKQFNITFQNYVDFHLITLRSLELLNEKIAENSGHSSQVSGLNFRPNMFVSETCRPFDEDHWRHIRINDTKFIQIENCFRCSNTTIEDETRREPIYTLRKFRRSKIKEEDKRVFGSPFFGSLLGTLKEGTIKIGDEIEAICVDVI